MKCYTSFRNFRFHFLFNPILFRAYKSFLIQSRVYEFSFLYFLITIFHFPFYTSFRTFDSFFFFFFLLIRYYLRYIQIVPRSIKILFLNFPLFSSLRFLIKSFLIRMKYYTIIHLKHLFPFSSFLSLRHFVIILLEVKSFFHSVNNLYNLSLILCIKSLQITHLLFLSLVYFFWLSFRPISIVSIILFSRIMIRVQIWMYPDKIFQVKAPSEKCNGRNATNCSTVIEMREQRKFLSKFSSIWSACIRSTIW